MRIRHPDDVNVEPVVFLSRWRLFRLEDGSVHLCGSSAFLEGRVSSALRSIDYEEATAVTRSGRLYKLMGEPGHDEDAAYLWSEWTALYDIVGWEDLTDEVWNKLRKP